jgi:hypothetical protein
MCYKGFSWTNPIQYTNPPPRNDSYKKVGMKSHSWDMVGTMKPSRKTPPGETFYVKTGLREAGATWDWWGLTVNPGWFRGRTRENLPSILRPAEVFNIIQPFFFRRNRKLGATHRTFSRQAIFCGWNSRRRWWHNLNDLTLLPTIIPWRAVYRFFVGFRKGIQAPHVIFHDQIQSEKKHLQSQSFHVEMKKDTHQYRGILPKLPSGKLT